MHTVSLRSIEFEALQPLFACFLLACKIKPEFVLDSSYFNKSLDTENLAYARRRTNTHSVFEVFLKFIYLFLELNG